MQIKCKFLSVVLGGYTDTWRFLTEIWNKRLGWRYQGEEGKIGDSMVILMKERASWEWWVAPVRRDSDLPIHKECGQFEGR